MNSKTETAMAAADFALLFRPFWDALPAIVAAMQPAVAATVPGAPEAHSGAGADPLGFITQTLERSGTPLPRMLDTVLSLLQQGGLTPLTEGLRALAALGEGNLRQIGQAWSGADRAAWQALLGAPADLSANPLAVGAERTFGAFADALGMRPMRELQDALQRLAGAESERRSALAAYLGIVAQAFGQGSQQLLAHLSAMAARGEEVTSLVAFVRLWAREADSALQTALQSEAGLAATAQAMRASLQRRAELQRLVALASTALNMPTRAEVDDAFREIQQLKRELRRLKKGPPALDGPAASTGDNSDRPTAKRATRKAAAKRGSSTRGAAKARQTGARK